MLLYILGALVIAVLILGLRVAKQYQRALVFRLGRLVGVRSPGLFWIIPLIEWVTLVDVRTITASVDKQETITNDNVPVKITAVVWYSITDPARAVIEVRNVDSTVVQVSLTSLRNIIGRHTLDQVLKEQESLSQDLRRAIDEATEPWGVKVTRVEMSNVEIPESMQRAMAQEAEAMREKRARIIKAEAELEAAAKLRDAAELIVKNPAGLELRRMQMMTEIGAENNTTTVIMMPSEFVWAARGLAQMGEQAARQQERDA